MEDQLYVRIRGRVQGPYDVDKLCALVRRGQLSRMHEVSSDGNAWKHAADYPELFASPAHNGEQTHSAAGTSSVEQEQPSEVSSASEDTSWYYAKNDRQQGPVTLEHLKALTQSGSLGTGDLVWTEGMADWVPAEKVLGPLATPSFAGDSGPGRTVDAAGLSRDVLRTLGESRPWVTFIAAVVSVFCFSLVVLGMLLVILGSRNKSGPQVAGGFLMLLYAAVGCFFAKLLFTYNSRVGRLLREASNGSLDHALRTLRTFWIFNGIVLIVILVNAIIGAVWGFSVGIFLVN